MRSGRRARLPARAGRCHALVSLLFLAQAALRLAADVCVKKQPSCAPQAAPSAPAEDAAAATAGTSCQAPCDLWHAAPPARARDAGAWRSSAEAEKSSSAWQPAAGGGTPVRIGRSPDGATVFLSSGELTVGIDARRGGVITHLSSAALGTPAALRGNLISTYDAGRFVQLSLYGCPDGSCWAGKPWRWNAVQAGDWRNGRPRLLEASISDDGVVAVEAVPRNWAGQQLLHDVRMSTDVRLLEPGVVQVRYTAAYSGNASHPALHQEIPAVFLHRSLGLLATSTAGEPPGNASLVLLRPGGVGEYLTPAERWAAYVDERSGFGVGVYSRHASRLVAYRVGRDGSRARSDTSYLALLATQAVRPRSELRHEAYLAVGHLEQLRATFARIDAGLQAGAGGGGSSGGGASGGAAPGLAGVAASGSKEAWWA